MRDLDLVIQDQNIAVGEHPTRRTTFRAYHIAHLQLLHARFYCVFLILNAVETQNTLDVTCTP
jgi:hypothetical protein